MLYGSTRKRRLIHILFALLRSALLIGLCYIILSPIYIKLSSSLKMEIDLYDPTVLLIPKHFTLEHYRNAAEFIQYGRTFFTTLCLSLAVSFAQLLSCSLVAYGLARFRFRARPLIYGMYICMLVIPPQAILLPLYIQFQSFDPIATITFGLFQTGSVNLIDTYWPFLMLSLTASAFKNGLFIYMLTQHFKNMPMVLEEAAYIDGCGTYRTFFKIMLPSAVPIMTAVFLFAFVWQWNDYYYSTILAPGLPLLSTNMVNLGTRYVSATLQPMNSLLQMIMNSTAFILQIIPLLILFIFAQKLFVQGIERSGIVG